MKIHKIIHVLPKENYHLVITFDDGKTKEICMLPFINEGISKELETWDYFSSVKIVDGYLTWENGYDFCPNFLYQYNNAHT